MIVFLISALYCLLILIITYFFVYKKPPFSIPKIIAFGGGFLSTLVLIELIPHTWHTTNNLFISLLLIVSGFLINALAEVYILPKLAFLNRLLPAEKHDCRQHDTAHTHHHLLPASMGCSAMGCFILCAFFDGLRLNSGFLINSQTGILICIGLLFHLLPESITIIGIGLAGGFSRKMLTYTMALFCLSFMAGALSFFVSSRFPILEAGILPLAAGLFLYVCSIHLIPASIKLKQIKWFIIGAVFCGVCTFAAHLPHT